jgi:hypothetical protein
MIGKIPDKRKDGKSSFRDLVAYCASKDPSKVLHIGYQNLMSPETAALEMESLATDNKRCKDPVFHAILSWREMEIPTPEQADEAVRIALKELNLENRQALWVLQNDTQNRHVHIVANRIDPETGKAIIPANGWTYKALERAARKIELIQGWESEQSGFYSVTENGEIVEKNRRDEPAISTSARDGEAHTAIKSAERIAREIAAPIIKEAKNWTDLHEKLAAQGITFEAKGSGAILRVGETAIKASKASRGASMSKLIARLGEYVSRPERTTIANRVPEPVDRAAKSGVKSEWERFKTARDTYFKDKKEENAALTERHKKERVSSRERQKAERDRAFAGTWKGRGAILNRSRSVMAARQQGEKLDMLDRQRREIAAFREKYPRRFVNFKTWLEQEKDQSAYFSYRYPNQGAIQGGVAGPDSAALQADLRAFAPKIGNKGGVAYSRTGVGEAEFIDYGKTIVLGPKCDEAVILAALQLACQKWGSAVVNGTEEYRKKCVELAIRHNLRIANPDLAKEAEEARKRMSQRDTREGAAAQTTEKRVQSDRSAGVTGADDPNGAYWIHYRDIAAKFAGTMDYSRIDGMVGVRMKATGYSREQIREAIETNAPAMRRESMTGQEFDAKYKNKDWPRYARETADNFVFGLRGLSQYESARKYRPRLMKLEGRDAREEARREYARRAEQDRQEEQISGR